MPQLLCKLLVWSVVDRHLMLQQLSPGMVFCFLWLLLAVLISCSSCLLLHRAHQQLPVPSLLQLAEPQPHWSVSHGHMPDDYFPFVCS